MTRKIPARLLRVRTVVSAVALAAAALVAAGCASQSSAPVSSSVPAAAASAASSAPAGQGTTASAHAVDKTRTLMPYGAAPDRSLAQACLVSPSYVRSSLGITDVVAKLSTKSSEVCEYAGKADWASTSSVFHGPYVVTMLTGHSDLSGHRVHVPNGAPFDHAAVALAQGGAEATADLTGTTQSVWFMAWDSHVSKQALLELAKRGLQNIMYWWSKSHSPAPVASAPAGSDGAQAPDLAACKVLPSSIFTDLLGGAAVANFNGSTSTLCTLNAANGATAVISDRRQQEDTSTLTSVGHNVWEQDSNTYMTFVNGVQIGVSSLGGASLINSQAVIAALAALN